MIRVGWWRNSIGVNCCFYFCINPIHFSLYIVTATSSVLRLLGSFFTAFELGDGRYFFAARLCENVEYPIEAAGSGHISGDHGNAGTPAVAQW
jgi:hypothetical protein